MTKSYLWRGSADALAETVARARRATEEMRREGADVRFVRSVFIPDDETCFHVLEAGSRSEARKVGARAGIDAARVVEATSIEAYDYTPVDPAEGRPDERD